MITIVDASKSCPRAFANGFSLIEITIAMAIAAVAMVAILGMLPGAMKSTRDAVDQTAIGTVLEDIHERIEGSVLNEGSVPGAPFFYDAQGRFWTSAQDRPEDMVEDRFFRADVELVKPVSSTGTGVPFPGDMLAAVVSLSWPVDESGQPLGHFNPRTTVTYMVTTLTGPDWPTIDPDYRPKIEY